MQDEDKLYFYVLAYNNNDKEKIIKSRSAKIIFEMPLKETKYNQHKFREGLANVTYLVKPELLEELVQSPCNFSADMSFNGK